MSSLVFDVLRSKLLTLHHSTSRCMEAYSYPLNALCQKVLNPKAGGVWYSNVRQFGHQSVGEDSVKSRAKVYEEQPSIAPPLLLQVGQCSMEGCGHGVLSRSVSPVDKLVWIKGGRVEWHDVTTDQFLKALHHHRDECYWPVVGESGDVNFFGQGDYGGGLQAGWDSGPGEWLIEDPSKDPHQLVRTVLQHMSADAVRSCRLHRVDRPQRTPHLMLLYHEDGVPVGCWMWSGCLWWLNLKTGKEVVQLFCQWGIIFSSPEAGPVVGDVLDTLPHLPAVVAVQMVLDPPPVVQLCLSDAPLQIGTCCAVEGPIPWSEGSLAQ